MKWADEPWRKLYTRHTAAWACLSWEAQGCVLLFVKTCEADGTIRASGPEQMARFWGWPADVISRGLAQLDEDGTITRISGGYLMPNFAAAQAARTSARQRKVQERERQKAGQVRPIDDAGGRGDHYKHVTRGHTVSHGVTKEEKEEKERRETPPATTVNPVIKRGAYRAAWPHIRALLMELQEPLHRDVSWPLTEPPYFLEAIRALGGEKPLSEALRSLQSSIISGHIPADRWHRRMFSPGSVDGWLALLDEHRTREQAREAQERREIERMEQDNKTNTASAEEVAEWERMTGLILGEVVQ